ncbi:hypothetical protein HOY80DRAFT_894736 [Tuber brumale]|nr:hypothetical protein HOY80DRAFT_894736 [Tuber brumale]
MGWTFHPVCSPSSRPKYEGEAGVPPLIDLDSDPQVNDTTRAPSRGLGFFSDIGGEPLNIPPFQTPSLLDEGMTEGPLAPLEPDGSSLPPPHLRLPGLDLRQVVSEAPQMEHIDEIQFQQPLPDSQDDSQATSIHGEDSPKSIVEDVARGTDSGDTDETTVEPPSNEASNYQRPLTIIEVIDKPPSPPPPSPSTTPIEENHSDEEDVADNSDGDDDSDIFEDAPQTPSDIVNILGGQETGKTQDEHLGAHTPLIVSSPV